jgi:hypothetical protein
MNMPEKELQTSGCTCCGPSSISPENEAIAMQKTGEVFDDKTRHDVSLSRLSYKGKRIESPDQNSFPLVQRPLYQINGTAQERDKALRRIKIRYERGISRLKLINSRNIEKDLGGLPLQNYYCIGCDIQDGDLRAQVLRFGAYPLLQVAMQYHLGEKLTLQCYFPQSYESADNIGPGGILGTCANDETPRTETERAEKYWNWTTSDEPPYLSQEDAAKSLWNRAETEFVHGLEWLETLPEELPVTGYSYPPELSHDLMAQLGVAAMQRQVSTHLDRDLVLLDEHRIIERKHLNWSLVA